MPGAWKVWVLSSFRQISFVELSREGDCLSASWWSLYWADGEEKSDLLRELKERRRDEGNGEKRSWMGGKERWMEEVKLEIKKVLGPGKGQSSDEATAERTKKQRQKASTRG